MDFVRVDGDAGGGQIVRNGLSIAALVGHPIHFVNIRGSRNPPGLREQHLQGVWLIGDMCNAVLEGAKDGSREVKMKPGAVRGGSFTADVHTAGSCTLVAQVALPVMLFAPSPSTLVSKGGTDVNWSPPIDWMMLVLKPQLRRFGIEYDVQLIRRGFYPKGGGEIRLEVSQPIKELKSITLMDRGNVTAIYGRAYASKQEQQDLHKLARAAIEAFSTHYPSLKVNIEEKAETPQTASGYGSGIILVAETDTGCLFGATLFRDQKQNFNAVDCGRKAAAKLMSYLDEGGCVDEYLQDQLLIYMALANGRSQIRTGPITEHSRLAMDTAHKLTPCKFTVTQDGKTNIISCDGIGLTAPGRFHTP